MTRRKRQQVANDSQDELQRIGWRGFEKLAVNRPAYHHANASAGMCRDVVIRRIEQYGHLPGYEPMGEAIKRGPNATLDSLPDAVLWGGGWLEVAEALARKVAGGEHNEPAFAVLKLPDLWDSRGKFEPAPDAWLCFDYPIYLVVARKLTLDFGDAVVARLMRRRY